MEEFKQFMVYLSNRFLLSIIVEFNGTVIPFNITEMNVWHIRNVYIYSLFPKQLETSYRHSSVLILSFYFLKERSFLSLLTQEETCQTVYNPKILIMCQEKATNMDFSFLKGNT